MADNTKDQSVNYSLIPAHLQNRLLCDGDVYFHKAKEMSQIARTYYLLAAACGLVASALDVFWVGEFDVFKAHEWGKDKIDGFVMSVAKNKGYKGDSLKGAIKHLEELFKFTGDKATDFFGGGKQHHLRDWSHHFSVLGLIFSLFTQFSDGKVIGTDKLGDLAVYKLKDAELEMIGKDVPEKIYNGVVIWFFHLVSDMAGSSKAIGEGTGIPGPILSMLKVFSSTKFGKSIRVNYKGKDIDLSVMISKLFNGTAFKDVNNPRGVPFDLRTELGLGAFVVKKNLPNIFVEVVAGAMFKVFVFQQTLAKKDIREITFNDVKQLITAKSVEGSSLTYEKMIAISMGAKTAVEGVYLAVNAIGKGNNLERAAYLLVNIDYYGIGRFAVCTTKSIEQMSNAKKEERFVPVTENAGVSSSYLSPNQMRIMYSLLYSKVQYDIDNTLSKATKEKKIDWFYHWQSQIINNRADDYIIRDDKEIYERLNDEITNSQDLSWLYMIAIELCAFDPFFKLSPRDKKNNLRLCNDVSYQEEVFCANQRIIKVDVINGLNDFYRDTLYEFSGRKKRDENAADTYSSIIDFTRNIDELKRLISDDDEIDYFDDYSSIELEDDTSFKGFTPARTSDNIFEYSCIECAKLYVYAKCVLIDIFKDKMRLKDVDYKLDSDYDILKQAYSRKKSEMKRKDKKLYEDLIHPIVECYRRVHNLMLDPNSGNV